MLCCEPESEQAASSALLAAAFDAFPDKDYCLLTLPPDSPEVALLGTFTRLLPPPGSALVHVLYLCHRFALLDQLQVGATHPPTDPVTALASFGHLWAWCYRKHLCIHIWL